VSTQDGGAAAAGGAATFGGAQHLFYSGQYESAAAIALALRAHDPSNLATFELRSSALHFQLKRALGEATDRDRAFRQCGLCPGLKAAFLDETSQGRAIARARLAADPKDETALFFLGKLDLNYVWLQLGTLGNRTGWNEYWEARRSLDAVLRINPGHMRARVARAWIDYIVDTRMTRGFRWMLGGGNKKRALATVREAASDDGDRYARAEAGFGLWEMEIREKNIPAAVSAARALAREFPDNQELARFLAKHAPGL
jgi:tetratricopeptide (TPR) repeat protein